MLLCSLTRPDGEVSPLDRRTGFRRDPGRDPPEREAQILQTQAGVVGLSQLIYAHLLGIVESSPRAAEIAVSAKTKMQALRGEG